MTLILLGFRRFAAFETRAETNVMRHHNSVFHSVQKHVPWAEFERLVSRHKADRRVRRLTTKSQFLALLFGQLSGASSLREIEAGLASHASRLYHLGGSCPARTTLADANARRPWQVYVDLFAHMSARCTSRTRRHLADAVHILDATRINLSSLSGDWLKPQKGKWAAKLHLVHDPDADMPVAATVTAQTVNDITPAKAMTIKPGTTYVFDLAYYDFGWWAELDRRGCRFVTRLKKNTRLDVTAQTPPPERSCILSDRVGRLPERMARSRRNPFNAPLREITVRIASGKVLRLATNDLHTDACQIADLYKARWQIELVFRWIKQNLRIKHFLGTSDNAVRIQIFVALIAYILLRLAQDTQRSIARPLTFVRLVRLNLMHRRSIDALQRPQPKPPDNPNQLQLKLTQT